MSPHQHLLLGMSELPTKRRIICRVSFEEAARGGKQTIDLRQYGGEVEVNIPAGVQSFIRSHFKILGFMQELL